MLVWFGVRFGVLDFQAYRYVQCTEETCVVEKFYARDSAGNETLKQVEVYVIEDAKAELNSKVNIRFISKKYYKDEQGNWIAPEEGGLSEHSVWRKNQEYANLLEQVWQQD